MFATLVAVAAISGFIGYSKATTSRLSALALANIEALTDVEFPAGNYFIVENSEIVIEVEDLEDRICNVAIERIYLLCVEGGNCDCNGGVYEVELNRDCVNKK